MSAGDREMIVYSVGFKEGKLTSSQYKQYYNMIRKSINQILNSNLAPVRRLEELLNYGTLDVKISNEPMMEWYLTQIGEEKSHIAKCRKYGLWQHEQEGQERLNLFLEMACRLISPRPLDIPIEKEEERPGSVSGRKSNKDFGEL